jgi:acetyl esterase/lipase
MWSSRTALAINCALAVDVANAWRPFRRRGAASALSYLAAWPASELPVPVLAAHLAGTGLLARHGAFRDGAGALNAVLGAGIAAGLVGLQKAAHDSERVYEEALVAALGVGYRARIAQLRFPGADAATARTPGVVRMTRIRRRFAHDHDISYGPEGRANLLDIWRRADLPPDAAAPVLVQVPGGAWITGRKQGQAYPLMSHLAERGWVCVAINYRHSPRNAWPAHIVDVKRALAWVKANIAAYGGDGGFVALTGGSAGGHLAALAALTPDRSDWQPGFEAADTSVAAAVPFYGAYDWTGGDARGDAGLVRLLELLVMKAPLRTAFDAFDAASPLSQISSAAPPFLVSHGANDALVPVEQARRFVDALRSASRRPVGYAELPRAQHAFDVVGTPRATFAAEAVGRFLGVVYGDYRAGHADAAGSAVAD